MAELCTCGHDELVHHGEYEPACTFTDDGGRLCRCIAYEAPEVARLTGMVTVRADDLRAVLPWLDLTGASEEAKQAEPYLRAALTAEKCKHDNTESAVVLVCRECGDHEADTAAAALRRVKALHFEQGGYCAHCSQLVRHEIEHAAWPCETAMAFSEATDDRPASQVRMGPDGTYVAGCGLCDWYDQPYSTDEDAAEVARLHVGEEHADD